MLKLDVPFTPDPEYVQFLVEKADHLCAVHFSMYQPGLSDARQRLESLATSSIIDGLLQLQQVPKFVLMNSRLHAPDKYFDDRALRETVELLELLVEQVGIQGLIFSDGYYLQALSQAAPDIAAQLEAVPSVNAMLDSPSRVGAILELIEGTHFRPPSKLVLDRALNRDFGRLKETVVAVRAYWPDTKIHLIANEGCLYQCPYKPAHDAHVAVVNEGLCGERTFAMNRDFGCVRKLLTDPGAMLASPFIRPEDGAKYSELVDGIKLCGRNRGTPFLVRVITAYLDAKYQGNLLDLMDAMGDLADRVEIRNDQLPEDFFERVSRCDKVCPRCGWCGGVCESIAIRKEPGLG